MVSLLVDGIRSSQLCPRCRGPLLDGQIICSLDVLMDARRASRAYELAKHRHPRWGTEQLMADAIAWIESGHADHRSPRFGCPFCIIS